MEVTARDLLRHKIKDLLVQLSEQEQNAQSVLITDLCSLFLDLDEERYKPPMIYVNPTTSPPNNPNPYWSVFPDANIPWWSPNNPYKVTMTTDASTFPTTYSATLEVGGTQDGEDHEEGEEGEPVPA